MLLLLWQLLLLIVAIRLIGCLVVAVAVAVAVAVDVVPKYIIKL